MADSHGIRDDLTRRRAIAHPPVCATPPRRLLSIIVPLFNEVGNVAATCQELLEIAEGLTDRVEIILVDDGSVDGTGEAVEAAADRDERIKVVRLCRNFGQTAAMMAGIDFARGDVIIPIDGDLQNDPADIERLVAKLDEGYDVVSGWRRHRQDHFFTRHLPSRIANLLVSKIAGVRLNDYGCSLKAYRGKVLKGVKLYGEMHRFIPIYASWQGARVTELEVNHRPRVHGKSKYGLERVLKLVLDLMVVKFLARYQTKPIYVFGGFGVFSLGLSALALMYMLYLKLFEGVAFILTPMPLLVVVLGMTGVLSILMGLQAELITRTYFESQNKQVYLVESTRNFPRDARRPESRPVASEAA